MHWKALLIVVIILVVYIILGGVAFHFIEETSEQETQLDITLSLNTFLENHDCVKRTELLALLSRVIKAYDAGVTVGNTTSPSNWDYQSAIFFATTVVSTIGYGHISPATYSGQTFCVFFAMIGIPLFLVAAAGLGEKILNGLTKLGDKTKCDKCKPKVAKALRSLFIILFGVVLFIFIPAGIFTAAEDWTYAEALYYSYITLTTIGFGDYVAGTADTDYRGWYRLCVSGWIVIGLAWMATVIATTQDSASEYFGKMEDKVLNKKDKPEEETDNTSKHDVKLENIG